MVYPMNICSLFSSDCCWHGSMAPVPCESLSQDSIGSSDRALSFLYCFGWFSNDKDICRVKTCSSYPKGSILVIAGVYSEYKDKTERMCLLHTVATVMM